MDKILAIVGSSRKKGNTDTLVDKVIYGLQTENIDIEVEKLYLSDIDFGPCIACEGCAKTCRCVIQDGMQEVYEKLEKSRGLILGSPTYFYNVSALTKKFIDRLYAYDIFDPNNRSVWLSPNEIFGIKYAVTVAVCEQEDVSDMGVTSDVMVKTLSAVGYRTVSAVRALHVYKKGEINSHNDTLSEAEYAGKKLAQTLHLAEYLKSNYK